MADPLFPPLTAFDVAAYADEDVVQGYRDYRPDDLAPGGNHPPGYRWGWANRRRDVTGEDDGMCHVRSAYIEMMKRRH